MKRLHFQIQPARSPQFDVSGVVARLNRLAIGATVTNGDDNVPYVNVDYKAVELSALWALVREELIFNSELAEAAIVVCEGQHGWDDYRLLHHFDPAQPLDQLG
jgi:hypothetical protein